MNYTKKDLERWYASAMKLAREGSEADEAYCQGIYEANMIFKLELELEEWDNE